MENVKFFIIDGLGMIIGELDVENSGKSMKIINPLLVEPGQQRGTYALSSNPLFEEDMSVNSDFVVLHAIPKKSLLEQYQSYVTKKKTGLITPKIELATR